MTPRIKKAYRHFNAFLAQHSCKQKFWRNIQQKANYAGLSYHTIKTKLLVCNSPQEWVAGGLAYPHAYPCDFSIPWAELHHEWYEYVHRHDYFLV